MNRVFCCRKDVWLQLQQYYRQRLEIMDQPAAIRQLLCPRDRWVNDKDVTRCKGCQKVFVPLFCWKHHCRFCGHVFCSTCAGNIMTGQSINYDVQKRLRHCDPCRQRIEMVLKRQTKDFRRKSQLFNPDESVILIQIDDPDTNPSLQRTTNQSLQHLLTQHRLTLQHQALALLKSLSAQLCDKYALQRLIWQARLAQIAWQAVVQTKPEIFVRKEPWSLHSQIKVVTIVTPTEAVAAVCVRGLILQRNLPAKHLETHMKYPRIVTIKPAIEADSIIQNGQVRFDQMIRNEVAILKNCMQRVFGLSPNIMFVQQHVSKGAFELAMERNIMVISKVKSQDLDKIQRIALIRRRIDNLLTIDRHQPAEMIGCCQKVYFKTVRAGEMLLFIQHEAGIRTVLLGDVSESSNQALKKVFDVLLRAAWNLKIERQVIVRDIKLCPDIKTQAAPFTLRAFQQLKYSKEDTFLQSQQLSLTKIVYCQKRAQNLSKSLQEYLKLRCRRRLLEVCGRVRNTATKLYSGQQISLGTFIMKIALQGVSGCLHCDGEHFTRFYFGQYSVNISSQGRASNKTVRLSPNEQDDDDEEQQKGTKIVEDDRQNPKLHAAITHFIQVFRKQQRQTHPRLMILMYFKCQDCGKAIGSSKARVGNDFLLMSLHHFLLILTRTSTATNQTQPPLPSEEELKCDHKNISRVIQGPRTLVKFSVRKEVRCQLLPIVFSQAAVKRIKTKDESMVSQLFKRALTQKMSCVQSIQIQMSKLPFSVGLTGSSFSVSIAGASALAHIYYQPFSKISDVMASVRAALSKIDLNKQIEGGLGDWTVFMRKLSKIDHVIKVGYQVINFISNALKKQKIQETIHSSEEIYLMNSPNFQQKMSPVRKYSQAKSQPENSFLKVPSVSNSNLKNSSFITTTNPHTSFISMMRKQTSIFIQTEFDSYLKRQRRQRYLKFQGAHLYYPLGNIEDPVSLLACCLNSDQFKENIKQPNYKDEINTKIVFTKQLKTDWQPCIQANKIYRQLAKEEFSKGESQEVGFAIYFHKQFQELRVSEGIDFGLYVRSMYGCQSWDSSGGKSNSSFSKAHNETLVVKIINQKEFVQFQKFAPAYLKYMRYKRQTKEPSYLAKIYGIYQVLIRNKVYKCVVMQNVFFGLDKITQVYDLKGSQVNRLAQPPPPDRSFTGLDTNFVIDKDGRPYLLEPAIYDKVIPTLAEDANFLKEQGVIDYSLLVIESETSLRMGIIDFMRPYHFVEKIETLYKEIKSGKDPTVIPPQQYAERFVKAMRRYFAKLGRS